MVKNENKNGLQFILISSIVVVSLMIGIVIYYNSLLSNVGDLNCKTLDEVMHQEKNNFINKLNSDKEALKGFAEILALPKYDEKGLTQVLGVIAKNTDFEQILFATPEGKALDNSGKYTDVSDRDYFHKALLGETVISEPVEPNKTDAYSIVVATPVIQDSKMIGVLIGRFEGNAFNRLFVSAFDEYGYTYIATNTGELIAKTDNQYALVETANLFELYEQADFYTYDSYEKMRQNLVEGEEGHAQYRFNNQQRIMHYSKLPINDWNIFVVINPDGTDIMTNQILKNAIVLIIALGIIFSILLLYNFINQKRFNKELTKMAYVDDVTGYRSFGKFKIDAMELLKNHTRINYILLKIDIEKFKLINEIYSMEIGDKILKAEAEALEQALDKEVDVFGRIHADEFVLLIGYTTEEERMQKRKNFENYFIESCKKLIDFKITLLEGRYKLQKEDVDFNQIYEKVNFAHKLTKNSNSKVLDFDGQVKKRAIEEKEIENRMEEALFAGEFQVFLQPKYRLKDEKIIGAEALVRWHLDNKSIKYPNEFIPLFEQNGFITKLDMYMFEKACKILQQWIKNGIEPITLSVNFSRLDLNRPDFVEELSSIADRYEVPHHLLEIELTETTMFENIAVLEQVLEHMHRVGFTLSMDDFGTGYSSLELLKNIPVDVIKIDKGFFDQSRDRERAKVVIASVIHLAKQLNIHTVAEGVETKEDIELLKGFGCEVVQGNYYAKPMSADALEIKLLRHFLIG